MAWLWISLLVLLVDQFTKQWAAQALDPYQPVAVVDGIFNLTLAFNTGAAFSFLSNAGGWQRWFFVVLAAVVSIVLVLWLKRLARQERWTAAGLALIIGGAVGNLIDRLIYGHVIDFLDFYYAGWHWPAFNVADSAITVGVGLVLVANFAHKDDAAAS